MTEQEKSLTNLIIENLILETDLAKSIYYESGEVDIAGLFILLDLSLSLLKNG